MCIYFLRLLCITLVLFISTRVYAIGFNYLSESVLEETEEVSFKFINNADISPDSKKIVLLPYFENDRIFIYDAETMKFIQEIKADNSFTNSILHKVRLFNKNQVIVPINYSERYREQPNTLRFAKFKSNDDLQLLYRMRYYAVGKDKMNISNPERVIVYSSTVLWNYDVNSGKYSDDIVFNDENINDSAVASVNSCFCHKVDGAYYLQTTSSKTDILLGKYDEQGNLQSIVLRYPEEFRKKLSIRLLNDPQTTTNEQGDLRVAYTLSDKIYNVSKGTHFKLKAKFDNTELFDKILKDSKYLDMMGDTLWKQVKLKVQGLYSTKANHTLVYIDYIYTADDSLHKESFLQIYDENNKFVQEFDIQYENAKGKLYYALFDKNTNRFFFFRKNEENWIVEKYKLEI